MSYVRLPVPGPPLAPAGRARTGWTLAACALAAGPLGAQPAGAPAATRPPAAPVRPVVDTLHGTPVADPYRYLERTADPEVQQWMRAQAAYTRQTLAALPGRAALLARITALEDAAAAVVFEPQLANGRVFYRRRGRDEQTGKLYVRDGLAGPERLLVDADRLHPAPAGSHAAISYYRPSPDARSVAYGVSVGGSEMATLHIVDVATGRVTPDSVTRVRSGDVAWMPDGRGLFYNRLRELGPGAPATDRFKASAAYYHAVGAPVEADRRVLGVGTAGVAVDSTDRPYVAVSPSSRWAVAVVRHGTQQEKDLWVAPAADAAANRAAWRRVATVADSVVDFAIAGEQLYLVSQRGAPRRRVLRTPLAAPDLAGAMEALPQGRAVVEGVWAAGDGVYARLLDGGPSRLVRLPSAAGGAAEPVPTPFDGAVNEIATDPRRPGVVFGLTSWARAWRYVAYDPATRRSTVTSLQPRGPFDDPADVEVREVLVRAADGTRVPLSIVARRGTPRDGSAPAVLMGYGAYGISLEPDFSPWVLAWLERGGVLANAHVRGGGEYGREWYAAGRQATKPNTWRDYIAAAQYLVDSGYTAPARLATWGASAGGITAGRAITERPDLFRAALLSVGALDMVRMETTANGVPNVPEFGSTRTPDGFRALLQMSAYHHVRDGAAYPAVLLLHGANDTRVDPWHSAKMAARLQAATASGRPVLLRLDFDAGHGIGSTKGQRFEQLADGIAFVLWQAGAPDFQPRGGAPAATSVPDTR